MAKKSFFKTTSKVVGGLAMVLALVFALVLAGCGGDDATTPAGDPELSGNITISPSSNVTTNTELTATYSGSETVTYQWKQGSTDVGINSNKYTPTAAGSYTVTVSASGFKSKTSATVTVTAPAFSITISGTPKFGEKLTAASTGNFPADEDFFWERADRTDQVSWTSISSNSLSGTNDSECTLDQTFYVGKYIRASRLTPIEGAYQTRIYSNVLGPIQAAD